MKQWIPAGLVLTITMSIMALMWAHRGPKVGYAETSVLMSQFSESIKAQKAFEDDQKEWENNLKLINDSLNASMNRLKLGYEKAPKKDQETMRDNLEKWNDNLQRYKEAVKTMSEDREKELMEPVIGKLNEFLKQWGKQHGYDILFGATSGGNLLQANTAFDVTSQLLSDLNERYKDVPNADSDSSKFNNHSNGKGLSYNSSEGVNSK